MVAGWTTEREIWVRFTAYPYLVWAFRWQVNWVNDVPGPCRSRRKCKSRLGSQRLLASHGVGARHPVPSLYIAECDVNPQKNLWQIRFQLCVLGYSGRSNDYLIFQLQIWIFPPLSSLEMLVLQFIFSYVTSTKFSSLIPHFQ